MQTLELTRSLVRFPFLRVYCWSSLWRQLSRCISLCTLFMVHDRQGQAGKLEKTPRSRRYVYSGWCGSLGARTHDVLSPRGWPTKHSREHGSHYHCLQGGAHTSLLHQSKPDQASTSWCTQCFKGSQLLYSYLQNVVWESLNVPSQLIFSLPQIETFSLWEVRKSEL